MGKRANPLGSGLRKKPTSLAEANKRLGGGKATLNQSPAFRKVKGKSGDRIGAGKLYKGMKSPV